MTRRNVKLGPVSSWNASGTTFQALPTGTYPLHHSMVREFHIRPDWRRIQSNLFQAPGSLKVGCKNDLGNKERAMSESEHPAFVSSLDTDLISFTGRVARYRDSVAERNAMRTLTNFSLRSMPFEYITKEKEIEHLIRVL